MEVLSKEALKEMDNKAINDFGIPSIVLMENAGEKIKNKVINEGETFIIICGTGNNGGDGLVVGRKLILENKKVHIFVVGNMEKGTKDFKVNLKILLNMKTNINNIENNLDLNKLKSIVEKDNVIIDALFGIGLNRKLEGIYNDIIEFINSNEKVISIDIPSGMEANKGVVLGSCVKATKTITLEAIKRGFIYIKNIENLGELSVINIDIPKEIKKRVSEKVHILPKEVYKNKIPKRNKGSHKGDFGKVAIVGGSESFVGQYTYLLKQRLELEVD
ncbi:NAD(P)H-hydrate epimerase [uncultured Clostridium sp.]|uniref:NAD(P)H-hydrate epimerase n=1 Tax=uncultured Clostridium sp. TaxID=59620 RepID=UPI00261BF0F0|nr:NAD(P)H-hydrate epimerase [uncultured Clostridium sp.]